MKPHTREFTAVLAAALVLAALAVVSLFIGSYPLSVGEIFDILTGKLGDTMPVRVFWQLRLPRMCMGLILSLIHILTGIPRGAKLSRRLAINSG